MLHRELKKGDIYMVERKDGKSFIFQYLADDENCLSGNVIRVFDYEVHFKENIDFDQLLESKVKFYAHVIIARGLKEKVWHKVSTSPIDDIVLPWFKHYEAVDFIPEVQPGWTVWQVYGKEKYLGKKIPTKYEFLPFAAIRPPEKIIQWFEQNKDPFKPLII